jgi:hypothetical protein
MRRRTIRWRESPGEFAIETDGLAANMYRFPANSPSTFTVGVPSLPIEVQTEVSL